MKLLIISFVSFINVLAFANYTKNYKYQWTSSNRLTQIIDSVSGTTSFEYNPSGLLPTATPTYKATSTRPPNAKTARTKT